MIVSPLKMLLLTIRGITVAQEHHQHEHTQDGNTQLLSIAVQHLNDPCSQRPCDQVCPVNEKALSYAGGDPIEHPSLASLYNP
jgi:Fe-S-cluster-containing dehydrogenase component